MTTWKQLSPGLRAAVAAPWLLLLAAVALAATPATRALLLDAADKPTGNVSLSSSNWTGTLDAARLPPVATSVNGQTGAVTGAQAVQGADIAPRTVSADAYACNGYPFVTPDANLLYPNGNQLVDAGSYLHYPNGDVLAEDEYLSLSGGMLNHDGESVMDGLGNVYWTNGNPLTDNAQGTLNDPTDSPLADSNGYRLAGGYIYADPFGNLYAVSGLYAAGTLIVDNQGMLRWPDGNYMTYFDGGLYGSNGALIADASGNVFASAGLGVWSMNPPSAQPAAIADATDLDSVIAAFNQLKAAVAAYGLIAQ